MDSELPSGLELGFIPTLKACFHKCEEEDLQKNASSSSSLSHKPDFESKSTKRCLPQQSLPQQSMPALPSSKEAKSTLSSESPYASRSTKVNEFKKKHIYSKLLLTVTT